MELAAVSVPAVAGDSAAFEALVAAHQKRIFLLALRMLSDAEEAATATQDCFLRAFRALDRCPLTAPEQQRWLARVVINLCLDRLRSRKWNWWRERLGLENRDATHVRTPERELLSKEIATQLARALERLSPRQRAVFVLRHYEGQSLDQIAEQLSLTVGAVKAHLTRAISHLRRELKDFYGLEAS